MATKDLLFSHQWRKRDDETEEVYLARYQLMCKMMESDVRANGYIAIINYGYPVTQPMLIRVNKYLTETPTYRSKIVNKLIADINELYPSTKEESAPAEMLTVKIGDIEIKCRPETIKNEERARQEIDRVMRARCALCLDTGWLRVIYPVGCKNGYFLDGFADKYGTPLQCPWCRANYEPPVRVKSKQNLLAGQKENWQDK